MSFFFTTGWGALYLAVLLVTMVPALWIRPARIMASSMLALELCDRISVTFLPDDKALTYLAFGYFLIAIALVFFHAQVGRNLGVAFCLTVVSATLLAGSFDWLSWDWAGTIQEAFGAIAMATIIWPRKNGSRVSDVQGKMASSGNRSRAANDALASRQAAHGTEKPDRSD